MNPIELYKYDLKSSIIRENEAREWIENVIGESIDEDFATALNDGIILCKLSNALLTDSTPIKFAKSSLPFKKMDNISKFLETLPSLGLSSFETFQTVDLFEKKNMNQVIDCIFAISRNAEKNGFQGPLIGNRHLRSRNSMNSTISNSSRNSEQYVNTKLSQTVSAQESPLSGKCDNYEEAGLSAIVEAKDSDLDSSNTAVDGINDLSYQKQEVSQSSQVSVELEFASKTINGEKESELWLDTNSERVLNTESVDTREAEERRLSTEDHRGISEETKSLKLSPKPRITTNLKQIPTIVTSNYQDEREQEILQPIPIKSPPNLQMNYTIEEQFEDSPDSLNYVEMLDESKYYPTEELNCFSPSRTVMETIIEESECSTQPTNSEDRDSIGVDSGEIDSKSVDVPNEITIDTESELIIENTEVEQIDLQLQKAPFSQDFENNSNHAVSSPIRLSEIVDNKVSEHLIACDDLTPPSNLEVITTSREEDSKHEDSISTPLGPRGIGEYPSREEMREKILKRQSSATAIFISTKGNTIIPDSPNDKLTFNPELIFLKLANLGYKQNFYCSNIHTKDTSVENIINVTNAKLQNLGYRF
ncbi:Transgelin-3 [Boothiomyces sp. JEL0866]|nr:Transgelin-3 [Boothiomyces sp. JEL0866]